MLAQTCSRIGVEQPVTANQSSQSQYSVKSTTTQMSESDACNISLSGQTSMAAPILLAVSSSPLTTSTVSTSSVAQAITVDTQNVSLMSQMQSITVGGQEAYFIPAQPNADANVVQLSGHAVQIGKQANQSNLVPVQTLNQSNQVFIQGNGQTVQQIPSFIQIPVSTAGGQTVYQTIQIGTVPIPVAAAPSQPFLHTSLPTSQPSGNIIATALATSQVQLKPGKKSSVPLTSHSFQISPDQHLVHTSNGYVFVPTCEISGKGSNTPQIMMPVTLPTSDSDRGGGDSTAATLTSLMSVLPQSLDQPSQPNVTSQPIQLQVNTQPQV